MQHDLPRLLRSSVGFPAGGRSHCHSGTSTPGHPKGGGPRWGVRCLLAHVALVTSEQPRAYYPASLQTHLHSSCPLSCCRGPCVPCFCALLKCPEHQQDQCDPLPRHAFSGPDGQWRPQCPHPGRSHSHPHQVSREPGESWGPAQPSPGARQGGVRQALRPGDPGGLDLSLQFPTGVSSDTGRKELVH